MQADPKNAVRLIVNADDFGLTAGIDRAIAELVAAGAINSSTLMANGAAFQHAADIARSAPALNTGCHVVLIDGKAIANATRVPSLVDREGRFRSSLMRFAFDVQRGVIHEEHIEAEAVAQIQHLQSAGVNVTHVDTHKHTHLFPRVARPLLRAAMRCGVMAIRNPFEDAWSSSLTRGQLLRKVEVTALRHFRSRFQQLLRASGLRSTDGSIGVSATGRLDGKTLALLLSKAPAGTWELVCHPGYNDADLNSVRTRLRETREVERSALLDLIPDAVREGRIQLLRWSDL